MQRPLSGRQEPPHASESSRPRVVVVGAGHLGSFHLQKIREAPTAELVGVVETDPERLAIAQRRFEVSGASTLESFSGRAEAAIIATPTTTHLGLGRAAMELGFHVLIEKPLALDTTEAEQLCASAEQHGRILQVGHVERFNPAVAAALAVADRPRYVVSERLGPFSGRSTDVDVLLDLMIHDLDIVAHLIPAELAEVRAIGVPVLTSEVDMASARLAFRDGAVAQLVAGRASFEPSRRLRLFTLERYVSIDCATREVKSVRRLPPQSGDRWPSLTGETVEVPAGDPLALQDQHFIDCIRTASVPLVDGAAGLRALRLVEAVKQEMKMPLS